MSVFLCVPAMPIIKRSDNLIFSEGMSAILQQKMKQSESKGCSFHFICGFLASDLTGKPFSTTSAVFHIDAEYRSLTLKQIYRAIC